MVVLGVLVVSLLLFRVIGALGVRSLDSWRAAARWALAVMLVFTASAHFTPMREDLVRIVPTWVPAPRLVVALTGVLEIAGAIGLLVPATRRVAGVLLILFFIAVFPANVKAAASAASIGGQAATALWLRAPMQLLFIALAWWVSREGR